MIIIIIPVRMMKKSNLYIDNWTIIYNFRQTRLFLFMVRFYIKLRSCTISCLRMSRYLRPSRNIFTCTSLNTCIPRTLDWSYINHQHHRSREIDLHGLLYFKRISSNALTLSNYKSDLYFRSDLIYYLSELIKKMETTK